MPKWKISPNIRAKLRKKAYRARYRVSMRRVGRQMHPSMDFHKFRCTQLISLRTNGAGQSQLGEVNSTFKSHRILNNTYSQSVSVGPTQQTGLNDVASCFNLFDNYRVQYCKITYTPKYNTTGSTIGAGVGSGDTVLQGFPTLYIAVDHDSKNLNITADQLAQRTGSVKKDLTKNWVFSWKPQKVSMVGTGNVILENGWKDVDSEPQNDNGECLLRTSSVVQGNTTGLDSRLLDFELGNILIEYYIEFKNRK